MSLTNFCNVLIANQGVVIYLVVVICKDEYMHNNSNFNPIIKY